MKASNRECQQAGKIFTYSSEREMEVPRMSTAMDVDGTMAGVLTHIYTCRSADLSVKKGRETKLMTMKLE